MDKNTFVGPLVSRQEMGKQQWNQRLWRPALRWQARALLAGMLNMALTADPSLQVARACIAADSLQQIGNF